METWWIDKHVFGMLKKLRKYTWLLKNCLTKIASLFIVAHLHELKYILLAVIRREPMLTPWSTTRCTYNGLMSIRTWPWSNGRRCDESCFLITWMSGCLWVTSPGKRWHQDALWAGGGSVMLWALFWILVDVTWTSTTYPKHVTQTKYNP